MGKNNMKGKKGEFKAKGDDMTKLNVTPNQKQKNIIKQTY